MIASLVHPLADSLPPRGRPLIKQYMFRTLALELALAQRFAPKL